MLITLLGIRAMHRAWTSRFSTDPDDRRPTLTVMDDFEYLRTDAFLHFGGRKNRHLTTISTISSHEDWLSYFTSFRSNSLNRINHNWISWALLKLTACRRKKVVTRFRLSVASMQNAKPPIDSTSSSSKVWRSLVGVKMTVQEASLHIPEHDDSIELI